MSAARARVLVVDDEAEVVAWLCEELEEAGYRALGARSAAEALGLLEDEAPDLVLSDVEMPGMRGTELLQAVHARRPGVLVLLITAFGSLELALAAMRAGACDFLTKPFRIETLLHALERALRERRMRREIVRLRAHIADRDEQETLSASPAMQRVTDLLRRSAQSRIPILLSGESGTGKSHLARFVHRSSPRAEGPFVQLNCAALPTSLAESELFGVRAGAFTDAVRDRPGLFREAHGGTLLLDEIGELPLAVQPKLLAALETLRVRPVGGDGETEVDVRLIAATNDDLERAVEEGRFRADLYFRLAVVRAHVPPLRERREDLDGLVDSLLHRFARRHAREVLGVSSDALAWIRSHPWPGNVRELANALERAVALSDHDTIVLEDLVPPEPRTEHASSLLERAVGQELTLQQLERLYLKRVLETVEGNKSRAARWLGIDRRTLYRKLDELERD